MAKRNDLAAQEAAEREEESQISEMIADTEGEIFAEATGNQEDENDGDHSLEEMEDPVGEDPDEGDEPDDSDGDEAVEASEEQGEEYEEQPPRIPPQRLREETEARRAIQRENEELRARLERVEALQRQPQQQPQQPQPEPDMFADPDGWRKHFRDQITAEVRRDYQNQRLRDSMMAAEDEYGEEYQFAKEQLLARRDDPSIAPIVHRIETAANPGRELMRWAEPMLEEFRSQRDARLEEQLAERYGVDVDTLSRALAMANRANGGRSPNAPQVARSRIPPSLNGAGGGGANRPRLDPRGADGSEAAIFADAFTNLR